MGTSYLVTGAKLRSMWGSRPSTLVIAQGHNFIADGRPKANCADCKSTALTMDSILLCRKGGIIVPETSGQGDVRKIDWEQLMARYPIIGFAAMLGKMGGSVFGFDRVNLNTGNFLYEKEDLIICGITIMRF